MNFNLSKSKFEFSQFQLKFSNAFQSMNEIKQKSTLILSQHVPKAQNEEPLLLIQQNMENPLEEFISFLKFLTKHYKIHKYQLESFEPVDFLIKFYDESFCSNPQIRNEISLLLNRILLRSQSIRAHFLELGFLELLSSLIPHFHTLLLLDTFLINSSDLQKEICSHDFLSNLFQFIVQPEFMVDAFYCLSGFASNFDITKIIRLKFGESLIHSIFTSKNPKFISHGLTCLSTFAFHSLKWTKKIIAHPLFFQYIQSFNFFDNINSYDLLSFFERFLRYDSSPHRDKILDRIRKFNIVNPTFFRHIFTSLIHYTDFLIVTGQISINSPSSSNSLINKCFLSLIYLLSSTFSNDLPDYALFFFNPEIIDQSFPESFFEKLQNQQSLQNLESLQNSENQQNLESLQNLQNLQSLPEYPYDPTNNPMLLNYHLEQPRTLISDLFILYNSDLLFFQDKILILRLILEVSSYFPLKDNQESLQYLLQMEEMGLFELIREIFVNDMFETSEELKNAIRNIQCTFESDPSNPKFEEWRNWLYFDDEISQGMFN